MAHEADLITFHTPLDATTRHLADAALLARTKPRAVIINSSRGEVVDGEALKASGREWVLDVWEHEPHIDRELLGKALLATPHIAGYSADGKANATRMSLDALCRFFHIDARYRIEPPAPAQPLIEAHNPTEAYLAMYDPRRDDQALRLHPERFEQLRGDYPLRREQGAFQVKYI